MGTSMIIGPVVGAALGTLLNYNPVDDDKVSLLASSRSGLQIVDSVSAADIKILTPTYIGGGAGPGYLRAAGGAVERVMDGNSYTIYCKFKYAGSTVIDQNFLRLGNSGSNTQRGIFFYVYNNKVYSYFCNVNPQSFNIAQIDNVDTMIKGVWVEVFIQINQVTKRIICQYRKLSDGSTIGTDLNYNMSTWTFTEVNNFTYMFFDSTVVTYADFKKFAGVKTIEQCRDNSYVTDLQFYYPTLFDGTDVSGNAYHMEIRAYDASNKYYDQVSTYHLDKGYSIYEEDYLAAPTVTRKLFVPRDVTGNVIVRASGTIAYNKNEVYIKKKDVAGNSEYHNLADSLIEINLPAWDRSNATIFSDLARAAGTRYDASNPKRWHIDELNSIVLNDWLNEDYKKSITIKVGNNSTDDRQLLQAIIAYSELPTLSEWVNIQRYTGDYKRAKTFTNGQLVITFDDGNNTMYTNAMQLFINAGVKTTMYCIAGVVGTADNSYINWGRLFDLYCAGFDMQCHSNAHSHLNTLTEAQLIADFEAVDTAFKLHGVPAPKHTAYPFGEFNALVKSVADNYRLTGRKTSGTQPFNADILSDKMEVPAFSFDEISTENLALLKSKIDEAITNNTAFVIYSHSVDAVQSPGYGITIEKLQEIFDYAVASGIEIVTMSELNSIMP